MTGRAGTCKTEPPHESRHRHGKKWNIGRIKEIATEVNMLYENYLLQRREDIGRLSFGSVMT